MKGNFHYSNRRIKVIQNFQSPLTKFFYYVIYLINEITLNNDKN